MGSLELEAAKKTVWLYPRVKGFLPSRRWGHSACYSNGFVYVFGGCCGGLHFSDVIVLNLNTMAWNTLLTSGRAPGPRDSHSAVLVGCRMIVFGGTNGSKKVNDLHILDLRSSEWSQPDCKGVPPSPRESHTATLIGDEKLVFFGGSGEGEANYLNDLHVLDLKTMRWISPEVKGDVPLPRDSHSAVAVGNKLLVYGGDCGDRYHGDVDMLDMETLTWSRLAIQGSSPGVRAGHAAVNVGTKIYVIGGVGDKQYYNDVWVLDVTTCLWNQLQIGGPQPQGRFSHTAIIAETHIAIYGGCGEDERPLNELVFLYLGIKQHNDHYGILFPGIFGTHCNQEKRVFSGQAENDSGTALLVNNGELMRREVYEAELESKKYTQFSSDALHAKRRRTNNLRTWEIESEQEEHSLSLSQHSSPSQSDQEQTPVKNATNSVTAMQVFSLFKQQNKIPSNQADPKPDVCSASHDLHFLRENLKQPNPEQCLCGQMGRHEARYPASEHKHLEAEPSQNLIGAEIRGKVDGAFDSGYLMTATVNGKFFRGVLFAPGPEVISKGAIPSQSPPLLTSQIAIAQPRLDLNQASPNLLRNSQQPTSMCMREPNHDFRGPIIAQQSSVLGAPTSSLGRDCKPPNDHDLQGIVLTLGGPGSGHD